MTNSFFAVNLPGNSSLLNISFSCSCFLTFSMFCWYFFLNSLTVFFIFSKFSFPSQVFDSAVDPFHLTKYLSFPLIHCLFKIFSISHFSSSFIITRVGCSFFYSFTCSIYFCILLTLNTGCIFTVLGSFNSAVFNNMIFLILLIFQILSTQHH